jgi:glycosyltransferase involved in cell wall biosynthesis
MKILVVTNLYPPHHQGGYELRCKQVVDHLHRLAHDVRVVTSSFEIADRRHAAVIRDELNDGVPVARFLRQHRLDPRQPDGRLYNLEVVRRQVTDITRFGNILDEFEPDLVSWWNLEGVTKAILRMPADRGIPSVHCIDDNWMIREFGSDGSVDLPFWTDFWRVRWQLRPIRPLIRTALAPFERRLNRGGVPTRPFRVPPAHVCFISEFWRYLHARAGLDVSSSSVIYGGVSADRFFVKREPAAYADGRLRLLYAGYVDQPRGLHTIVDAIGLMTPEQRARVHLSIASGGPVAADDYVRSIERKIVDWRLAETVTFLGRVRHDQMPAVYASHHALVFASVRNEGLPMVMMEAMCAGCAVPNTGSGGSIELSDHAGTPLFPKDHPFALSRLLVQLEQDRARLADVALRGQQTILRDFRIDQMLDKTTAVFARVARPRVRQPRVRAASA